LITALTCRYRVQIVVVATMDNRYCRSCVPTGDLGVDGADRRHRRPHSGAERTPPGYPDDVDAAQGPVADRCDSSLGDLEDPGTTASG
jgi:hypothetical protein